MKQSPQPPVKRDHLLPTRPVRTLDPRKLPPATQRLAPTPLSKHRKISYVPGEKPRKEFSETPQLYIQGLGGSIKMDLGGIGTRLSNGAFLHWVSDDSLLSVGIHSGDIVLIEPAVRRLHAGNLLLVEADGRAVLLRLRKNERLWVLEPVDGEPCESMSLHNCGIQGVAIGVIRVFNKLRPHKYKRNDTNRRTEFEIPFPKVTGSKPKPLKKGRSAACQPASSRPAERLFPLPPTDGMANFRLNDTNKQRGYKARPDKR